MLRALYLLTVLAFFATACSPPYVRPDLTVPVERRPEEAPLPKHPDKVKWPSQIPTDHWVYPDAEGCGNLGGLCVSEGSAYRLSLFKVSYDELRAGYEADRDVWKAQRELYETKLQLADKAFADMQPSWWEQHRGEVGFIGGLVLGGLAVGLVAGAVR